MEPDPGKMGDEIDGVIRALADKHRRFILHELSKHDAPIALSELADRLSSWGNTRDRLTVQITLIHSHLPVLEHANLIFFDSDSHSVTITGKGECANDGRKAYLDKIIMCC